MADHKHLRCTRSPPSTRRTADWGVIYGRSRCFGHRHGRKLRPATSSRNESGPRQRSGSGSGASTWRKSACILLLICRSLPARTGATRPELYQPSQQPSCHRRAATYSAGDASDVDCHRSLFAHLCHTQLPPCHSIIASGLEGHAKVLQSGILIIYSASILSLRNHQTQNHDLLLKRVENIDSFREEIEVKAELVPIICNANSRFDYIPISI